MGFADTFIRFPAIYIGKGPQDGSRDFQRQRSNCLLYTSNLKRITATFPGISYPDEQIPDLTEEKLEEDVLAIFHKLYDKKEEENGKDRMREIEKMVLLRVVDNRWMDHIDAMDDLKQGIGLRSLGHINPANAYAAEGFDTVSYTHLYR